MQAVGLFWSSTITIRSWAGSLLHGDRFGLTLRAYRLYKSRGTIEYFGSSIANGSMAEDGTKIPRSRSPEAGERGDETETREEAYGDPTPTPQNVNFLD